MSASTVQMILALLPVAESLIFNVGGKLIELNTKDLTQEELLAALDASRSGSWPELKFVSPVKTD